MRARSRRKTPIRRATTSTSQRTRLPTGTRARRPVVSTAMRMTTIQALPQARSTRMVLVTPRLEKE